MIEKLPPPANVTGIRSFLGRARFYQRIIKDFSWIAKPLSNLLEKDALFIFDDTYTIVNQILVYFKDEDIIKEYNPKRWISIDEAEEILSKEIDEYRKKQ